MKKKLQTIIASALVVVAAAIPVFANVTGIMTSTSTTMTTVPVDPDEPDVPDIPDKPEQKLPDYFIDLKDGLKVGKDYSGITVGANASTSTKGNGDMLAKETTTEFELDGVKYTSLYLVQGTDNPKPDGGNVPTTGAFIKVKPVKNGTFTVVVNQSNVKDIYFVLEGMGAPLDTFKTVANQVIVKSYEVKKGETYYFYASGSKVMIGAIGIKYNDKETFEPVTGITGVAEKMTAGETITLNGTVVPATATNKSIVWSIKDAGTTEATLSGNKLTAKAAGTVVVTAKIEKGLSDTKAYTQDFTIEVEAAAATEVVKLGDVNKDNTIDAKDALAVLKFDVGVEQSDFVEEAADINKDTKIDAKDALEILKHDVGLITIDDVDIVIK